MKKIETDPIGARILEMVCTEQRGSIDDLKSVVRLAPKFRKLIGDRRDRANNALAVGPGEAREKILAEFGDAPVELVVEDADLEFAVRRFRSQPQWPDSWAELVLVVGEALEDAADVVIE